MIIKTAIIPTTKENILITVVNVLLTLCDAADWSTPPAVLTPPWIWQAGVLGLAVQSSAKAGAAARKTNGNDKVRISVFIKRRILVILCQMVGDKGSDAPGQSDDNQTNDGIDNAAPAGLNRVGVAL